MQTEPGDLYRFGGFTLDRGRGEVVGTTGAVALRPKSFALLCHFVEHAGRLLSKDEIGDAVWPDVAVTDESITRCISDIRTALGDRNQELIRTMPGRGYLFAATVDKAGGTSGTSRRPSLAVLPFVELGEDDLDRGPQGYFGRGIAEDLIVRLSKFPGLRVIARNSALTYRAPIDELQAGRELGVRYLVLGGLRRAGDRIRLNVRLVDATTGAHLWAERYDRQLGALFEVQDELTRRVAGMLIGHLRRAEVQAALQKPPERLDAYDLYLRGIATLRAAETADARSDSLIADARELLQKSLAADPRYASTSIALSVTFMGTWGTRRRDPRIAAEHRQPATIAQALRHAERAVALDPMLAEAHAQLGWCLYWLYRRDEAASAYGRARQHNASLADPRYGLMLSHDGYQPEAIAFMRQVEQLDPFQGPFQASFLAHPYYLMGDYETALTISRTAAKRAPAFARIRLWQAAGAARLALNEEAREAAEATLQLEPNLTIGRYLDHVRFRREEDARHLAAGLRAAGFPE
jgi:adenylate cyclase